MVDTADSKTENTIVDNEYAPLFEYLCNLEGDTWSATFGEIEAILGFSLPQDALTDFVWWINRVEPHSISQALAWGAAGWLTSNIDLERENITFIREYDRRAEENGGPRRSIFEDWPPHDFGPWPEGLVVDRDFIYGSDQD